MPKTEYVLEIINGIKLGKLEARKALDLQEFSRFRDLMLNVAHLEACLPSEAEKLANEVEQEKIKAA